MSSPRDLAEGHAHPTTEHTRSAWRELKEDVRLLAESVNSINERIRAMPTLEGASLQPSSAGDEDRVDARLNVPPVLSVAEPTATLSKPSGTEHSPHVSPRRQNWTSRIILTTYPGQAGIDPLPLSWAHPDPKQRGPVVVSRQHSTIGRRNAIGAHGGSYSIYHALAVASNSLDVHHKPDFTNTEPAVEIGPFVQWSDPEKIVSLDPLGHLAPWLFQGGIGTENVDIRPTIAITKAHMSLPEMDQSVRSGRLVPDGKICLNTSGELAVTKFAIEPVWYLPGVAKRFGIDEGILRRSLFENTGGSFPELITRSDIKVFLPPIGGMTV